MSHGLKLELNQKEYLKSLKELHSLNLNGISEWVQNRNEEFEKKIEEGQEKIIKKKSSVPNLKSKQYSNDLKQYLNQRKELQQKLRGMGKVMQKEPRESIVLSDEERQVFLKKMREKQAELQKVKDEHTRVREFKERQKQQQQKFQKDKKLRDQQKRKRKLIQKRLEELSEQKQRRQEEIRQRNRQYQEVAHQKALFHRLQQNYNKVQNQNLQVKKRKLAQIREIHKPMSKTDFQQHLKHIKQCRDLANNLRDVDRQERSLSPTVTNRFYKSHWYKEVINEEKAKQEEFLEQKKESLKELKDRQKKYSQYIRHNCVPQTDEKLMQEMQKRMPSPIKRKKAKEIRQMGLYNLKSSKQCIASKQQLQAKRMSEAKLSQLPQQKPKNYLQQLKKNRRSNSLTSNFLTSVNKKQTSQVVKVQTVKTFVENLQRKAEQRQQLQRVKKNYADTELNDMYMGALNAKLKLIPSK